MIPMRVGGACLMVGSAGIFIGNFLHPFPPADRAGMLDLIASHAAWPAVHLPAMFFAVTLLVGLVALADSVTVGAAAAFARAGRIVAQVGVPVMLVGVAIDGFGFKVLADAWAGAAPAEQAMMLHAADAIIVAETAVLHVWVSFFLGVAFTLYGLALASGTEHSRWLGWLAVAGGVGCLASGLAGFLRLPVVLPFPVFGTVVLAWSFLMGLRLVRRRGAAQATPGMPQPAGREW